MAERYKRVVVKIGSNVLSKNGELDVERLETIADDVARLRAAGVEVILISSGAVASGRGILHPARKLDAVESRQLYSAVGQVRLISEYYRAFGERGIVVGQVLTTKEDFASRRGYINQRNCIETMLENGVVPIVNENDTISLTELMFTDNDELSGVVATMMGAGLLIILSNIDGIYTGDPQSEGAEIIAEIREGDNIGRYIQAGKSSFGRGGMLTKTSIARKVAGEGIPVIIANGTRNGILDAIVNGSEGVRCTRFVPSENKASSVKKWIAHSEGFAKGVVVVNHRAAERIGKEGAAVSVLPVGVVGIEGDFEKGDIVKIAAEDGETIGVGKAEYGAEKARAVMGLKGQKPVVHYDYLFLESR